MDVLGRHVVSLCTGCRTSQLRFSLADTSTLAGDQRVGGGAAFSEGSLRQAGGTVGLWTWAFWGLWTCSPPFLLQIRWYLQTATPQGTRLLSIVRLHTPREVGNLWIVRANKTIHLCTDVRMRNPDTLAAMASPGHFGAGAGGERGARVASGHYYRSVSSLERQFRPQSPTMVFSPTQENLTLIARCRIMEAQKITSRRKMSCGPSCMAPQVFTSGSGLGMAGQDFLSHSAILDKLLPYSGRNRTNVEWGFCLGNPGPPHG